MTARAIINGEKYIYLGWEKEKEFTPEEIQEEIDCGGYHSKK